MDKSEELNQTTEKIIGAAIRVHQSLGPELLESSYEACLAYELIDQGLEIERQKPLPVIYRGVKLDCGYRVDLLINKAVIVEIKAVEFIKAIHKAQLLSYLRLFGSSLGLLINFNERVLKNGLTRVVNNFPG